MNIWTCKAVLVCAGLLAACDAGVGFPFGLSTSGSSGLKQAALNGGAVTLVAPTGFCIDEASLRDRFALMARCDTLGAAPDDQSAPLAVITATTLDAQPKEPLQTGDLGASAETVLTQDSRAGLALVQVQGTPPDPRLDDVFWRGSGQVGEQVIGLAFYTPEGAQGSSVNAPEILSQTLRRTQAESPEVLDKSATPEGNSGLGALLSGLFE